MRIVKQEVNKEKKNYEDISRSKRNVLLTR